MNNEIQSTDNVFAAVVEQLARRDNSQPEDYLQDGILMCGKCHTPKQILRPFPVFPPELDEDGNQVRVPRLLPVACKCKREAEERAKEIERQLDFETWMSAHKQYGISGGLSQNVTFDADDGRDPEALEICRRYVRRWGDMRDSNIGILFSGPNGTGKSFHAGMIVNELLKKRVRCIMTSFPTLLGAMEKWGEKTEIVNYLGLFDLVVIDDLGAERTSEYSFEQVYHVVDARYRQGKPLIVTTNLLPDKMKNTENIALKRIFDRVLEMCAMQITLNGADRRVEQAKKKRRLVSEIMGGNQA